MRKALRTQESNKSANGKWQRKKQNECLHVRVNACKNEKGNKWRTCEKHKKDVCAFSTANGFSKFEFFQKCICGKIALYCYLEAFFNFNSALLCIILQTMRWKLAQKRNLCPFRGKNYTAIKFTCKLCVQKYFILHYN